MDAEDGGSSKKKQAASKIVNRIKSCPKGFRYFVTVGVVIVLAVVAIIVYRQLSAKPNTYLTVPTLERMVNVSDLGVLDYPYTGIAEKDRENPLPWEDSVEYRIKYVAHIRSSYDMPAIKFAISEDNAVMTAYLPDVQMGQPVIDDTALSYLPDNANANIDTVLSLCKQDAASEINVNEFETRSLESLKKSVEVLTKPLLSDDVELTFSSLSECNEGEAQNESR